VSYNFAFFSIKWKELVSHPSAFCEFGTQAVRLAMNDIRSYSRRLLEN